MRKLATKSGQEALFLFVAELNGYKTGTIAGKVEFGKTCWLDNVIPHEPHEGIWAQRLYKELYGYQISLIESKPFYWTVPIELDVAASMLQIIGALLGDKQLLSVTNAYATNTLQDPWGQISTVKRSKAKDVLMRQLYGSSQSASAILDDVDEEYSTQEIIDLEAGLHAGAYGVANAFKKFLIGNCNLEDVICPQVWKEQLEVPCNRHHVHGEKPVIYSMLDARGMVKKVVHWKTVTTPDLKSFRRWVVTGLIHAIDSQIVNSIMAELDWGLDIHDAVICNPEDALLVRKLYAEQLEAVYRDRQSILNNYFESIGIKKTAKAVKMWNELKALVEPLDEPFNCSIYAMK